jgi:hypothetical protein
LCVKTFYPWYKGATREVRRILIPRTSVNKGKRKGREFSPARQINRGLRGLRQEVKMRVA